MAYRWRIHPRDCFTITRNFWPAGADLQVLCLADQEERLAVMIARRQACVIDDRVTYLDGARELVVARKVEPGGEVISRSIEGRIAVPGPVKQRDLLTAKRADENIGRALLVRAEQPTVIVGQLESLI